MITRRTLLATAAGASVAACASLTTAQVVTDIEDFATALLNDLPSIGTLPGLSPSLLVDIKSAIPILAQIHDVVGTSGTAGTVPSLFQELLPFIKPLLAGVIIFVGATTPIGLGLAAASILLPVILSALGIPIPEMARLHPTMTIGQARIILAQRAHR